MNDLFNQEDVDQAVPHTPGTNSTSNYVCRKCFRSLESYVKIKNTLQLGVLDVGKKLLLGAKSGSQESTDCQPGKKHVVAFYALLGHFVLGSAQLSTPTRKRRSDGGSLLAKRRRIDTPMRGMLDCMHPQVSPLVSVRV